MDARRTPHAGRLRACAARRTRLRACARALVFRSGVKFPWLNFPFVRRHMLRLRWMSIEHVKHVKVPILFVVGLQDELVPPQHTRELQRAAAVAPLVRVLEVPDGTHNDTWAKAGATFVRALSDFFAAAGGAVGERSARLKAD
jgi:pimeloyl-ACP methyl ester carboxylesterase